MSAAATPMFPLGTVLFPGVGLPLRIFEPRYRTMIRCCLEDGSGFGVVLIAAGREVGGGDDRFDLGTMAQIVHAEVAPDGQAAIVAVGATRFRVSSWLPDDPFPQAVVSPFVDADQSDHLTVAQLTKRVRRLLAQRAELNLPSPPATIELADDPDDSLWQLCALLPIEQHDALALLATPSAAARCALVGELLNTAEAQARSDLSGPNEGGSPDPTDG